MYTLFLVGTHCRLHVTQDDLRRCQLAAHGRGEDQEFERMFKGIDTGTDAKFVDVEDWHFLATWLEDTARGSGPNE